MFHNRHLTRSAAALLAAGTHLCRKDGDPIALLQQAFEKHDKNVNEILDGHKNQLEELKTHIFALEQKGARRNLGGGAPASWGQEFITLKSPDLAFIATNRGRTSLEIKATITSATADAAGSAGGLVVPHRDTMAGLPRERMTIRNLLNVVQVSSGSVEYPRQVARNLNAGMVAETAKKPESDLQFKLETLSIRTIAHFMKASRQILDDAPQLRDMIDGELRYGLALKEEQQLLYGDGTGQNLDGLVPQAVAFVPEFEPAMANMIDTIGLAILQAALADHPADGVVIHPADWMRMRLLKDDDGHYLLGDPQRVVAPSLFGLPVVATKAMTAGEFLVGAFSQQTLYDRWSARVEVGFENDDFTKNLVTVLAEERVALAAKQPDGLIHGEFEPANGEGGGEG